jgi:proline iminopeptidase
MYPKIEPYDHGMLDVGDGHRVYWEACGNPDGKPALVVHGGPGSGCGTGSRSHFDPAVYRVVLFDQRNCGRSTPHASEPVIDLSTNTTDHLIRDMEQLREHLGIDKWLVFGGSWGSVLSVTYALRHPERVSEMIVTAVATGRHSEIEWLGRTPSPRSRPAATSSTSRGSPGSSSPSPASSPTTSATAVGWRTTSWPARGTC